MSVIVIMVLIAQNTFMGSADPVTVFVVVDSTEQTLPAASDLMSMLVIVIGVCPKQAGTAVSDLVPVLVIMVRAIRQDARTAENLLHRFRLLKTKAGAGNGSCPQIYESLSPFLLSRVLD